MYFNNNENIKYEKITDFYIYDNDTLEKSYFYKDSEMILNKDCHADINNYIDNLKSICRLKEKGLDENNIKIDENKVNNYFAINSNNTKSNVDFSVNIDNEHFFRGHIIYSIDGKIYQLRRIPKDVKNLKELNFDSNIRKLLLHENLKQGGLILITGETGQGKTTTCSATIKDRLSIFSGFCLTVENPPEYRLHGIFEKVDNKTGNRTKGVCVQTEVLSGNFAEALQGAMRSYPVINNSILYVGETRDSETAREVLKIMTNGHLVITTMHADNVFTAIKRFVSLASNTGDQKASEYVLDVLGASLRLILHQKLKVIRNGLKGDSSNAERKLEIEFLYSPTSNGGTANAIRQMSESGIKTIMERQKTILANQGIGELIKNFNTVSLSDKIYI